jgi:heme/copper-type cytochrome/quinol oxidase subunit 4
MKVVFSVLFVIAIIVTVLVLCVWFMHCAGEDCYPAIKDL